MILLDGSLENVQLSFRFIIDETIKTVKLNDNSIKNKLINFIIEND